MNVRTLLTFSAALGFGLAACGGGDDAGKGAGGVDLTGAGSTFLYPLISSWSSTYAQETGTRINYSSIGSGAGIRQFSEQTVDFGATDGPMSEAELGGARGGAVIHVPLAIGAVAVAYNVPALAQPLTLSGDVIAEIFLGRITRWDDARIAGLNPGVALPAEDIVVVYRTDGSGTTYVFTDYLAAVSQAWANGPGRSKQIRWPVGLGAKGNEGVAAQVKQTPGAISYTELAYVKQNRLQAALVRNAAGNAVAPSIETMMAAAEAALDSLPSDSDFRISIVDAPGAQAYPITSLTWALVYAAPADSAKAATLDAFLRWALTDGDQQASALDYAPLPDALQDRVLQRLDSLRGPAAR